MAKTLKDLLLKAVEEEKMTLQYLNDCMVGIKERKRESCSHVSFLTKEITPNDVVNNEGKVGIIIWLKKDFIDDFNEGT